MRFTILLLVFSMLLPPACSTVIAQQTGATASKYPNRKMLLRDEGLSQVSYIDIAHPENNWYEPVPVGRDIQLVGNGRVLIGTGKGYEERDIATGKKVFELITYPGTVAARRLRNGNTLLTGIDFQGKKGIVLVEVNKDGTVKQSVAFAGFNYVRLVRETPTGTYLITADDIVFEGNAKGAITWRATLAGMAKPHAWQAVRLGNRRTLVSTGYSKNLQLFTATGRLIDSITGPAEVHPNFYAGFQILSNGNFVVANWQGHGTKLGGNGHQVVEYTPKGELAWSWQQYPDKFSSIQGVIILDGLDLNRLYVENVNGRLAAVKTGR